MNVHNCSKTQEVNAGIDPFPHYAMKHRRTTLERAEKFISDVYFNDVNLFSKLFHGRVAVESIKHHGPTSAEFDKLDEKLFKPFSVGQSFGPTFTRHWFELCIKIPKEWIGYPVHLIWNAGCEGMVWRDGQPVFSLTPVEDHGLLKSYTLTDSLKENEEKNVKLFISISCNRLLGEGKAGMINPPDMEKMFTLHQADIVALNKDAFEAFLNLQVIYDVTKSLPAESQRSVEALFAANDIINKLVMKNFSNEAYSEAKLIAKQFFSTKNRSGQHLVHAMGHCHIDSAWLWRYDETVHKCARSWLSTIALMEKFPDFTFTCSQAQQFAWVKNSYPQIFERLKKFVSERRFLPVGGVWVEMDGNLPSGESMVRQFIYGQRFFREEFGITCREFWLPDTFGYSGNLPQIMKEAGISNFLTQKLSWNLVNKFPHNTFFWEGIDGTRILTHFPPGDSYGMKGTAEELLKTLNNNKDKGRCDVSMFLFGHGDGGGGPTEEMLHRLSRLSDCAEIPKVKMSSPDEFFTEVRKTSNKICSWVGELFLEIHNGTYTTQAKIKKYNRQCEVLLHHAEFISTLAWLFGESSRIPSHPAYPRDELERMWKLLLLNQFHDVLPGTSIQLANEDALQYYEDITRSALCLIEKANREIFWKKDSNKRVAINSLSFPALVESSDNNIPYVECPSLGFKQIEETISPHAPVLVKDNGDGTFSLRNSRLSCTLDCSGRLASLSTDPECDFRKELVKDGCLGNQMVLFDDVPLFWDAWDVMDYHLETRSPVLEVSTPLHISETSSDLRAILKFSLRIGEKSQLTQTIELDSGSPYMRFKTKVNWQENHKFLKVEFPWTLRSPTATYEIQFGQLERPTHQNTSWDTARYEVWAHKWMDLSEYDHGVALLNDCKYGCSTYGDTMRLSLLRSSKAPDGNADMGTHEFTYEIFPHRKSALSEVIRQAHLLNNPVKVVEGEFPGEFSFSFARVDTDAVILDTCKKSDMHEQAVLLRLYECLGSTVRAKVEIPEFKVTRVSRCNILEDVDDDVVVEPNDSRDSFFSIFTPFQIQTFLIWLE